MTKFTDECLPLALRVNNLVEASSLSIFSNLKEREIPQELFEKCHIKSFVADKNEELRDK